MKCPNCNETKHDVRAKFCRHCGAPLFNQDGIQQPLPLRIEYGNVFCTMTKYQGGKHGYTGTIEIPTYLDGQKVTAIGDYAFFGDSGLSSITLPDTLTHIGELAFSHCGFTEITIPDSVVMIGKLAFYECLNLSRLILSNSLVSISDEAFMGCRNLTKISIPPSVRRIGNMAFYNCKATSIIVPSTVESIDCGAFVRSCDSEKPVSIVFPKKFLSKRVVLGFYGGHLGGPLKSSISIKDENGNDINYEDLPDY